MTKTIQTLKRIAEQQNVSQANLARRMRTTETSICRWFKGERQPTIKNVEKMCDALDVQLIVAIK